MFKTLLLILLFPSLLFAKTIKVAIIDSGLDNLQGVKLCKSGLIDLTNSSMKSEYFKHGNNITHIIVDNLETEDYCVYHIKAFSDVTKSIADTQAFAIAILLGVDIINYSAGGAGGDIYEEAVVALAVAKGIKVFVAAGNDGHNLDKNCNYFPACYKIAKLNVVGNLRNKTSNYGKIVNIVKDGNNVKSGGVTLTGSSQSTALATREELIKQLKGNK